MEKVINHDVIQGMGAIVHKNGVAFRVWAPNADSVFVIGDFNYWSDIDNPLSSEENGYWYVDVKEAKAGDEYKFVIFNGDLRLERIDPYAKQVTNSTGNGVIYDPISFDWKDDNFQMYPHNELVIYEMHLGSFFTEKEGKVGNFETALKKLEHIKALGVNAIQIMPVTEFAGDYSWGYNPSHIFAVESAYGGPDKFKLFIREAHKMGFAIIQDVVYNHFGPSDLELWQFDGWSENGKGGIYFYNDEKSETPWGSTRPDYGRPEVRNFIKDNAKMWIEEYHVNGLRYDSTLYIRSIDGNEINDIPEGWSLMQEINNYVREVSPFSILIAEDWRNNTWLTMDINEGGAGFHTQCDANFVHPVREILSLPNDENRSMGQIKDSISFIYNNDSFRRVIYSESHDEVANGKSRLPQEINPEDASGYHAQKRSILAAGLVFTTPGIPMLFQGQEFLEGEYFRDDVPLDWNKNEQFQSIVRIYHDLINLRLNHDELTRGLCGQSVNIFHINENDKIAAFQRWDQHGAGDDVVIVCNFSGTPKENYEIGMPNGGLWKLRLNSDAKIYSGLFNGFNSSDIEAHEGGMDNLDFHSSLSIGEYSILIFSQDKS